MGLRSPKFLKSTNTNHNKESRLPIVEEDEEIEELELEDCPPLDGTTAAVHVFRLSAGHHCRRRGSLSLFLV
ncbi:unnamed protein product [Cuscuta campestris]|uniref:Uncharacterized protein n=1 Tax=Cuscuta campestris TaxID=132261 RepID=A0A484MAI9_9ASTE|nr:unnamed protein product [Cuscuta campestris]